MRPFEVATHQIGERLEDLISATFEDLESQFLIMPRSGAYIEYSAFQYAYEVLKRRTGAFSAFTEETIWRALREDALAFVVLRTILGVSPPEWVDLARTDRGSDITTNVARSLDRIVRDRRDYFSSLAERGSETTRRRVEALISVAVEYIRRGAPADSNDVVHRLNKADTAFGLESLRHSANAHIPYSVLLYERFFGQAIC